MTTIKRVNWRKLFGEASNKLVTETLLAEAAESRISELERERDAYKKMAEDAIAFKPAQPFMLDTVSKARADALESQLSTTQEALRKCQWKLYECGMELSYVQEAEVLSLCKSAKGEALCNEVMQLLGVDYSIETEEELHRVLSPPTKLP